MRLRARLAWRTAFARALVLACVCLPHPSSAAASAAPVAVETNDERALERRVKSAFLFRFTEFVHWPEAAFRQAQVPFIIGVAGQQGYADELRQITDGRTVYGRPVEVRRIADPANIPPVQVLLLPASERHRLREWVRNAPRNALIVTESEGALSHGSVINFVISEGRVRFEISLEAAEKRGLRMSSRLLALALAVRTSPP